MEEEEFGEFGGDFAATTSFSGLDVDVDVDAIDFKESNSGFI